jgi:protoporphyrin/coproporphyrin ferrochelatase
MIEKPTFDHPDIKKRTAVLFVNLGTPTQPNARSLRKYLREFLWDKRVVEIPRVLWWLILNFIILTIRPKKSAKLYQSIWTDNGSPLSVFTQSLTSKLNNRFGDDIIIDYAMRYGDDNIPQKLEALNQHGFIEKLLVIPLYPQYSATTTASVFDAIAAYYKEQRHIPTIQFLSHYHDKHAYIEAVAKSITNFQKNNGKADKLLLSFHGIPKRNLLLGDPYYCECIKTARLLSEALNSDEDELVVSFQSRFGRAEWLKPYTSEKLKEFGEQGKSIQVVCPGFAVDCLETLEEIKVENSEIFTEAGGTQFEYISCLNDTEIHIDMFYQIIGEELGLENQR